MTGRLPQTIVAAAVAALGALSLAGCAVPGAIETYDYLADYARMQPDYDPLMSLVYAPQPVDLAQYRGIIIGEFSVGDGWVQQEDEAVSYSTFFRICLQKRLTDLGRFEFVTLDSQGSATNALRPGALRIEGMLTCFDMGSGALRYFSPLLLMQLGATDLQIEGRVLEADSGRVVFEFADRRRHMANTPWGPNTRNFTRGFGMSVTAAESAQCFAAFVELACEGLPATDAPCSEPQA